MEQIKSSECTQERAGIKKWKTVFISKQVGFNSLEASPFDPSPFLWDIQTPRNPLADFFLNAVLTGKK